MTTQNPRVASRCRPLGRAIVGAAAAAAALVGSVTAPGADVAALKASRRPTEFFSIFNFGYGGDDFPDDIALFERIVVKAGAEGHFNAVLCSHSDERAAVCRKHGMKMMIDLLNDRHHVYRTPDETRALLERLRGDEVVMGYHLWSDRFGDQGAGRLRDIRNVNEWDPTHPAYAATYKTAGMDVIAQGDIFGWYDFHWKRSGWNRHFAALDAALPLARANDSVFYSLLAAESGLPGKGNYNRSLWSLNQGIAFGMKGALWFIGMSQMNKATAEWTQAGLDVHRVNAHVMPLKAELMRIGLPSAVYATPITKDANDRAVQSAPALVPELAAHAFPADFWIQPVAGEFTMGVFRDPDARDAVYVANINAYAAHTVTLSLGRPVKTFRFDRMQAAWVAVPETNGSVTFDLGPAEAELLRFEPQ